MVALWIDASAFDNADEDDRDREGVQALSEALLALGTPDWYADALCLEYPAEWWFPERGESSAPAKEVCSRCIAAAECEAFAHDQGAELVGIWAGTSTRQRMTQRRAERELGIVA